jgi:hypothetical protein
MLPSVDGIKLKLQRAYQQLDTLKIEMANFLKGDCYEPAIQFRRIRGAREARCVVDFTIRMVVKKPCEPMWSVIIGEIVHDLRSGLDHLVYQLVIHATGNPPTVRTQFPIFLDATKFDIDGLKMLRGVGTQATALIKTLQRFSTGEGDKSPLWHLNQLSNIDKHRTIHLTGGTLQAFNFSFPPIVNPGRIERRVNQRGAFQNNTVVAEGRMFSDLPMFGTDPHQMKVNAEISFDIVFDQRMALVGEWSVLGTLLNAADRSRDCIAKISRDILSIIRTAIHSYGLIQPRIWA